MKWSDNWSRLFECHFSKSKRSRAAPKCERIIFLELGKIIFNPRSSSGSGSGSDSGSGSGSDSDSSACPHSIVRSLQIRRSILALGLGSPFASRPSANYDN